MRKIVETNEFNVYKFEELSEQAKKFVKNDYLDMVQEESFRFSEIVEENLYHRYGLSLKPYYSLSYSQGDGLCLVGDIDIEHFIGANTSIMHDSFSLRENIIISFMENECGSIEIKQNSSRYYHKNTLEFEYENCIEDIYENEQDFLENCDRIQGVEITMQECIETMGKFLTFIEKFIKDLCDEYENMGYDYFYEISQEDLQEWASQYEFYENGRIY